MTSGCRSMKFQLSCLRSEQTLRYTLNSRLLCRIGLELPSKELCLKWHFRLSPCASQVGFSCKCFLSESPAYEFSSPGLSSSEELTLRFISLNSKPETRSTNSTDPRSAVEKSSPEFSQNRMIQIKANVINARLS